MVAVDTNFTASSSTVNTLGGGKETRTLLSRQVVDRAKESLSAARNIGSTGGGGARIYVEGLLGLGDAKDTYSFRVDKPGTFKFTNDTDTRILNSGKINVKIYDAKGNIVIDSTGSSAKAVKDYGDFVQGNYSGFTRGNYTIEITRRGTASSDTAPVPYNFNITDKNSNSTFFSTKEVDPKTGDDQQVDNQRLLTGSLGGALSDAGDTAQYNYKVTKAGTMRLQLRVPGVSDIGTSLNDVNVQVISLVGNKTILNSASKDSKQLAAYKALLDGTLEFAKGSYAVIITRKSSDKTKYVDIPFDAYLSDGVDTSAKQGGAKPAVFTDQNPASAASSPTLSTLSSGLLSILGDQSNSFTDWMNGTGSYAKSGSGLNNFNFYSQGSSSNSTSYSSVDFFSSFVGKTSTIA